MTIWPRSLATRTALVLLVALALVQAAGLTIHALDRVELQRLARGRDLGVQIMSLYRSVAVVSPDMRTSAVRDLELPPEVSVSLDAGPPPADLDPAPGDLQRLIRVNFGYVPMQQVNRPTQTIIRAPPSDEYLLIGMRFPDTGWLHLRVPNPPLRIWHSSNLLQAFVLMTLAAAVLIIWAVRRLTSPVATLAAAAEALGRDVNAPPLPEQGPSEVVQAAKAFNTMAARIRRFVADRTFMLTAIGHDLRTPITRLKLRAEFIDDEEMSRKFLADLAELEAMVSATLVFGRDTTNTEPICPMDLPALLRTVLDEAADASPDMADKLTYRGPDQLTMHARPMALKRAFGNLIGNALKYGGQADVALIPDPSNHVVVTVEDNGPGIPPGELDRVFEPFHRVEASRNRETGGVGLGLPIVRNILRAHGGDVTLANRPRGGVRATVVLPA